MNNFITIHLKIQMTWTNFEENTPFQIGMRTDTLNIPITNKEIEPAIQNFPTRETLGSMTSPAVLPNI